MKHKGLIITLIVVVVVVLLLAVAIGAGILIANMINKTKEPITAKKFGTVMEKQDFEIYDIYDQYAEYGYVEEAIVALEDYQIEFYVLDSTKNAERFYNHNVSLFEKSASSTKSKKSFSFKNGEQYKLTSNGSFMAITRIDDTVVYADVDVEYKDEVEKILEQLGY